MNIPGLPSADLPTAQATPTVAGAVGALVAGAQLGLSSLLIRPRRSIGDFVAQATVSELHTDELQITEHPVQQGASIADHAFKMPAQVVIEAEWSNSPTVGLQSGVASGAAYSSALTGTSPGQVTDIYAKLLALQNSRVLFDVYTGKRVYRNMLIKTLVVRTDQHTENALKLTATCREVIIVTTEVLTVPSAAASHADPGSTMSTTNQGAKALTPAPHYHAGP